MADYETLYPGRFLKKETLAAPKVIRILEVNQTILEGERGAEAKVILKYKAADGEGEIVWCKTNSALTAAALGTRDYGEWIGKLITIHNNPQVDLKGKKVGGIRVYGAPTMTATKRIEIKRPRRKNPEVYTLVPTDNRGNPKTTASANNPEPEPELDTPPDMDGMAPDNDNMEAI